MKKTVLKKQNAATHCFVCGVRNPFGLHTDFFELEDGSLAALVTPRSEHQSYPGRLHGGVIAALLDETIGRAINISEPETWAVTAELSIQYKKPVPYDVELKLVGRVVENTRRVFTGNGELLLPGGEVAATATGKYVKLPLPSIADFDANGESWRVHPYETDPAQIDLPEE